MPRMERQKLRQIFICFAIVFFCDPEITFRISQYNSEECLQKRSDFKFAYT